MKKYFALIIMSILYGEVHAASTDQLYKNLSNLDDNQLIQWYKDTTEAFGPAESMIALDRFQKEWDSRERIQDNQARSMIVITDQDIDADLSSMNGAQITEWYTRIAAYGNDAQKARALERINEVRQSNP